jgi:hypothetical protein
MLDPQPTSHMHCGTGPGAIRFFPKVKHVCRTICFWFSASCNQTSHNCSKCNNSTYRGHPGGRSSDVLSQHSCYSSRPWPGCNCQGRNFPSTHTHRDEHQFLKLCSVASLGESLSKLGPDCHISGGQCRASPWEADSKAEGGVSPSGG